MTYETKFAKIEKKWQQKWESEKAFEPKISREKKKLLLTVPYPYTSGPLHIGHGRTYTIADVYARFKRMQGFNVLWPMAFHITGTPILAVSKRIEQKDPSAISTYTEYIGQYEKSKTKIKQILNSFAEPQNVADYFADVIIRDFRSLGFSIDWTRRFTTGDKEYNKFVEWQFYRLKELGLITKGDHTVLYCTSDKNAVGEDDIQNGDTIEPGIQEYVLLKFKFEDSFIIAATLRAETVYGQTNLWVKPEINYVEFEVGNEKWIGSRDFFEKLQHQGKNPKELEKISGNSLVGKTALAPGINHEIIILPAPFPNPDIGSGIVTSVPAHSIWDYIALRELKDSSKSELKKFGLDYFAVQKVEPIPIIKVSGYSDLPAKDFAEKLKIKSQKDKEKLESGTAELYKLEFHTGVMRENCGDARGLKVSDAKELVKKNLISQKQAEVFQDVSALELPVKCRCGGKVVVSLLKDQWYINYGDEGWKENARICLEKMKIIPDSYRQMFSGTINWLHERACARLRGLGTKLPWDQKWIIESLSDSTIYTAFYTVINLIRHHNLKPEQLGKEFWNFVFLGIGNAQEVAKHTGIRSDILKEIRDSFEYWYPCELRHTAVGHITNHLTFYIFNHVALFDQKFWPAGISLNEFLICEGAKMSKSKGNVIPLADIPRKYGADLYRLYIAGSANLDAVVDWREKNVVSAQKRLNKLYEIADEIIKKGKTAEKAAETTLDRWIKSRFNTMLRAAVYNLENMGIREYSQLAFFESLNDIAHYLSRSGKKANWGLLFEILESWLKVLAPLLPHTAEEFWEKSMHSDLISLEDWPEADESAISHEVELSEELVKGVNSDILQVIELAKKKKLGKISLFVAPAWKHSVYKSVLEGSKLPDLMKVPEIKIMGDSAVKYIQNLEKKKFELKREILSAKKELEVLEEAKDYLKHEFSCKIEIFSAEKSDHQKAKVADVMKPGIYLE